MEEEKKLKVGFEGEREQSKKRGNGCVVRRTKDWGNVKYREGKTEAKGRETSRASLERKIMAKECRIEEIEGTRNRGRETRAKSREVLDQNMWQKKKKGM